MKKKFLSLLCCFFLLICLEMSAASAQDDIEESLGTGDYSFIGETFELDLHDPVYNYDSEYEYQVVAVDDEGKPTYAKIIRLPYDSPDTHIFVPEVITVTWTDLAGDEHPIVVYVAGIDTEAFAGCENLTHVYFPAFFFNIDMTGMFKDCPNLQYVDMSRVKLANHDVIDEYAFYNCPNLKGVKLPSGMKTIGKYAFAGSKLATTIDLMEGFTEIDEYAFADSQITGFNFPNSLQTIRRYAFAGCTSLKKPNFSVGLENI